MNKKSDFDEVGNLRLQIAILLSFFLSAVIGVLLFGDDFAIFLFLMILMMFPFSIATAVNIIEYVNE